MVAFAGAVGLAPTALAANGVPRFDHVVLVTEENNDASSIYGNTGQAPYINALAAGGAEMTQSFAVDHPSEPNYLALFSGSEQGVVGDPCPVPGAPFSAPNIGSELIGAGLTFSAYAESMPSDGFTDCASVDGMYVQRHNVAPLFANVPAADNRTFASFPQGNFASLPTVSYVAPNLCDDMHDCSIATGDTWLHNNIDAYAQWAKTHNSLLIVTFDEALTDPANQIATIFYGAHVKTGAYSELINHYNVLRTLEDAYGLSHAGNSATASPIADIWTAPPVPTISGLKVSPGSVSIAGRRVKGKCVKQSGKNKRHQKCRLKVNLTISYSLNVAAPMTLTFTGKLPGRKVKGKCKPQTRKNAHRAKCTRSVTINGGITLSGKAGANTSVFNGAVGGRQLGPGSYVMMATAAGGNAQTATFKITG